MLMSLLETRLVYPSPPAAWGDWAPAGRDFREAWIDVPASPGVEPARLHGWFFAREGADHAVLYLHGNGEDVSGQASLARLLRDRLNAAVLVFDYRGYGRSRGNPHESGVVADGVAAQAWLAQRTGRTPDGVVLVGRSLGGGVATAVAAERGAAALVLQSTFTRLTDAAAHHYPWLPVRWLMRNRFDSLARIGRYGGPVLVSHGTADEVVPFRQGVALYEAAPGLKRMVELPGVGHCDPQPPEYYDQLAKFLTESLPGGETTLGGFPIARNTP